MNYQLIQVHPASPLDLKYRIYRLRYSVYIDEFKYKIKSENNLIFDELDNKSISLLAIFNGKDIGTIRYTKCTNGPLESARQCTEWAADIAASFAGATCEVTRLVITKEHRGRGAMNFLISEAMKIAQEDMMRVCFFAAKPGAPVRFWRKFQARISNATLSKYCINDFSLGYYHLMVINLLELGCSVNHETPDKIENVTS